MSDESGEPAWYHQNADSNQENTELFKENSYQTVVYLTQPASPGIILEIETEHSADQTEDDNFNTAINQSNLVSDQSDLGTDLSSAVTDQSNSITNQPNALTDHSYTIADQFNIVSDLPNAVTDQPDAITDQCNIITDKCNAVTDHSYTIIDQSNTVSDLPNTVTDQTIAITDQHNVITNQCNAVTDQCNIITDQSNAVIDLPNAVTDQLNVVSDLSNIAVDQATTSTISKAMQVETTVGNEPIYITLDQPHCSNFQPTTSNANILMEIEIIETQPPQILQTVPGSLQPNKEITMTTNDDNNYTTVKKEVELFAPDTGPRIYVVPKKYTTPPVIAQNLPAAFEQFNIMNYIYGNEGENVDKREMLKIFVGSDLDDETFDKIEMYCSPNNLKNKHDISFNSPYPVTKGMGEMQQLCPVTEEGSRLKTVWKNKLRNESDVMNRFKYRLKYRGMRFPRTQLQAPSRYKFPKPLHAEPQLEPGKDLLFKIKVYRPFPYNPKKKVETVTRHPLFNYDLVVHGRQSLVVVRDHFPCHNDIGLRVDVSENPQYSTLTSCKEIFPSGFLFINNVLYNDTRPGCKDYSAVIREWAQKKKMDFPALPLDRVLMRDLVVKLGHPEVYVHQGDCEHLFTFSEIRLVNLTDELDPSKYPIHSQVSINHSVYCTTCAEFVAKWIVTGSERTPFDPSFFCETCFLMYMYKGDQKIGDFKAYPYMVNEVPLFNY